MRIRDAITKPVLLATVGAVALTAVTTIAIVGSTAPPRESFGCRMPPAPRITDDTDHHHPLPTPPVEDARPLPQVST